MKSSFTYQEKVTQTIQAELYLVFRKDFPITDIARDPKSQDVSSISFAPEGREELLIVFFEEDRAMFQYFSMDPRMEYVSAFFHPFSNELRMELLKLKQFKESQKENPTLGPEQERYLSLRKLWKLQVTLAILLLIAVIGLEVYMGSAGYPSQQTRIRHTRLTLHSLSFLFYLGYVLLVLLPISKELGALMKAHPDYKTNKRKVKVGFPKKETWLTLAAAVLVLFLAGVDFANRKPLPKREKIEVDFRLQNDIRKQELEDARKFLDNQKLPSSDAPASSSELDSQAE